MSPREERELRFKGELINDLVTLASVRAREAVNLGLVEHKLSAGWAIYALMSAAATLAHRLGFPAKSTAAAFRECADAEESGASKQAGEQIAAAGRPS